jgi:hypothetical protein
MKKCNQCKNIKELTFFNKSKNTKDGLQYKCKICESENNKLLRQKYPTSKYYNKNKEYYKNYSKNWIIKHKDNWNEYLYKYKKENIDKIKAYQNTWVKEKYKNDINYKLKINIKGRIIDALNKGNLKKGEKIITYLGCSIKNYKFFIESQFKPEMTWENHGIIWEIDHIVPISNFDLNLKEHIYKAFNYLNTQPLFKTTKIARSFGYLDEIGNRNKSYK